MEKIKVYIYGAGYECNRFFSYITAYSCRIEVVGIVTTERQKIQSLDGYPCIIATEMDVDKVDYIIIAIEKWKDIIKYLKELGIENEKMIPSKVFSLPYFELDAYLTLKKEKVTILSNTCLGAFLYNELGLEYFSPTIWLGCWGENFLKFVEKFEYYLTKEMEIYKDNERYKENPYTMDHDIPKGILDNEIIWDFIHSVDVQKTMKKWNERKERCNFENVAIVMLIHTDEDAKRFEKISHKKKIGIYYKNLKLKSVIYCPEWDDEKVKYGYDWVTYGNEYMCSTHGHTGKVNWIKFLTGKENFIRF